MNKQTCEKCKWFTKAGEFRNVNKFYSERGYGKIVGGSELDDYCKRFPVWQKVNRNHFCGSFKKKPSNSRKKDGNNR
ncbi:MAG TPA: hypothetical protein ENH85_00500 [Candidatus Scalindua sp.]|nr:hypothetical protein [Candidatus Scalindua sp.]